MKPFFTDEQRAEVAKLYFEGMSSRQLAARYATNSNTICRTLEREGMARRPVRKVPAPCNEAAFDGITEHSAYWIGFLMADGHIGLQRRGSGQQTINLCLSSTDEPHIEKFKTFMQSKSTITRQTVNLKTTEKTYHASKITIYSDRLTAALAEYGVVPQKSKIARALLLESNRDFWRGYIDGNGSMFLQKQFLPILCCSAGSKMIIDQLADYICSIDKNPRPTTVFGHGSWDLRIAGARAVHFGCHLYNDSTIFLDRKREKLELLIQYTPVTESTQYFKPPAVNAPQ